MRFTSLKWKMVSVMLVAILLPLIVLGALIINMTSGILQSQVNKNMEQVISQVNMSYDSFFEKIGSSLEYIAASQHVRNSFSSQEDEAEMVKEFIAYISRYPDAQYVYMGMEDGRMIAYPESELPDDYDPRRRGWYQSAKENRGQLFWTEPYIDAFTGEYIISAVIEISDPNGMLVGVLGVDINLQKLTEIMASTKVGNSGFTFAVDGQGITITHADKERIGQSIGEYEWGQQIINNASGALEYSVENIEKYVVYQTNNTTGWKIAGVIEKKELTSVLTRIKSTILIICIIGVMIAFASSFYAGRIVNPIKILAKIIGRLSKYDLSFDEKSAAVKYMKRNDEIGLITNALATMQNNLVTLIKSISGISEQVASSSEELTATSHQSAAAANEVARTIEEIAKGASDQARNTEEGVLHVNELGQLIEKDQEYAENLNNTADEVSTLKDEGMELLKDLVQKTKSSNMAAQDVLEVIINTNDSAKKIEDASQMIQNIAKQTNMLAINAAIEAARAGESGMGFAVVAEEIRRLSEQSNSFTEEISEVIQELTDKTSYAVKTMQEANKLVASQAKSVEDSNQKFEGIAIAIDKMKKAIDLINQSGYEMANKKNHMISVIENLSAISEENAAGTQEASASIEEQTSSMEEIANASEALSRLAEEMQESISRFKY